VLVTGSIGTRLTADHVVPVPDVLYTMSFDEQFRASGNLATSRNLARHPLPTRSDPRSAGPTSY
jgi:hypothetical protein